MNHQNTKRLNNWRNKFRAAGSIPNIAAHMHQQARGINWRCREETPTLLVYPEINKAADPFDTPAVWEYNKLKLGPTVGYPPIKPLPR